MDCPISPPNTLFHVLENNNGVWVVHIISRISLCISMNGRKKFGNYLLKTDTFTSRNSYKRAVLRGQLSLIGILVGLIYTIIDLINHLYVSLPFYALLILLCAIVFWINR